MTPIQLMDVLSDGATRSGEALAQYFGVSRTAIWKHIRQLQVLGAPIEASTGEGYRLTRPFERLEVAKIRHELTAALNKLTEIEAHWSIDSTNTRLLQSVASRASTNAHASASTRAGTRARPGAHAAAGMHVCVAEHQSAGRGRRGNAWVSPLGGNLYFSLARGFEVPMSKLGGLSLVAGVSLIAVLQALGASKARLKWPNDVWVDERKLAGILVEVDGEVNGPCRAVIGIGVNLALPDETGAGIAQPWTDLQRVCGAMVSRNILIARLIQQLHLDLCAFEKTGLEEFSSRLEVLDALRDRWVRVVMGNASQEGKAVGIDRQGHLLVEVEGHVRQCHSGEVSVRVQR